MPQVKKTRSKKPSHESAFKKYVLKANRNLTYVVSTHLFIEGLMSEWLSLILPKPQKLFQIIVLPFSNSSLCANPIIYSMKTMP